MGLVPMTESLFDEINKFEQTKNLGDFVLMTTGVENHMLKMFVKGILSYIEADYFGGYGTQSSIVWKDGTRSELFQNKKNAINSALKLIGVSNSGFIDEFQSLQLGRHLTIDDWMQ